MRRKPSFGCAANRLLAGNRSTYPYSTSQTECADTLLPQALAGQGRALGHGGELRPDDLGMADARPDAAVGPGLHVLPAHDAGEVHQPVGHQLGMLDEVRRVAD